MSVYHHSQVNGMNTNGSEDEHLPWRELIHACAICVVHVRVDWIYSFRRTSIWILLQSVLVLLVCILLRYSQAMDTRLQAPSPLAYQRPESR
jgi:hypothetical protein